jgi:superfamily I DNA/RNA helicase
MTKDDLTDRLLSDERLVVVEAPAGCGKTYQAAVTAIRIASSIGRRREILLLAHTNGAVQEFRARIQAARARVRAVTLDSFALELLRPYAAPLGLPDPIRPDSPAGPSFPELAPRLLELLRRAPTIAKCLAAHYPFIILDEHQDARSDQHQAVFAIARAGDVRVRIFGDPMQNIFSFEEGAARWEDLTEGAGGGGSELRTPWRWIENERFGRWILDARSHLMNQRPVSLRGVPDEVKILHVNGADGAPPIKSTRVPHLLIAPLQRILNQITGTVAILTRNNAHAVGVRTALKGRVQFFEGADPGGAYKALDELEPLVGNPVGLARAVIEVVNRCSTGITTTTRASLLRAFRKEGIHSKSKVLKPLLGKLAKVYETPDLKTSCRILHEILVDPPGWLRCHSPETLRLLGRLRDLPPEDAARDALAGVAHLRRYACRVPFRCVTTVHKAKGREFDHVILVHAASGVYGADDLSRRILYVALSRPRKSLWVLLPEQDASPLFAV